MLVKLFPGLITRCRNAPARVSASVDHKVQGLLLSKEVLEELTLTLSVVLLLLSVDPSELACTSRLVWPLSSTIVLLTVPLGGIATGWPLTVTLVLPGLVPEVVALIEVVVVCEVPADGSGARLVVVSSEAC
jgi:hypothetical protein